MDLEPDKAPDAARATTDAPSAGRLLLRLLRFSFSYRAAIALFVGVGVVVATVPYVRAYLAQPLMDDVLLPIARGETTFDALLPVVIDLSVIFGLSVVVQPIAVFLRSYWAHWVVASTRRDIDQAIAQRFLAAPLQSHRSGTSGDFLARALADAQLACQAVLLLYNEVLKNLQFVVIGAVALFAASWQLALLTIAAMPPLVFALGYFGRRVQRQSHRRQETQGGLSQQLLAILSGIKVIKAFQGQELEEEAYSIQTGKYFRRHMKVVWNGVVSRAIGELVNPLIAVAVLGFGIWLLIHDGMWNTTAGTLIRFAGTLFVVYKPVKGLIQHYPRVMESVGAAQRLFQVLDMEGETPDREGARTMTGLRHGIRFCDVHFDYGEGPVLCGIDLEVAPGEVLAVVGRTGTGKSTLVDLVLRFHDPSRGAIEIDGVDLRDYARDSYLDRIAVVTQEPFLFDLSVLENIRYGRRDASAEEVHAAASAASAHEFIRELPEGYDTPVGEFGLRLSGGQRQRLTIARAILADPAILVFDEATSALDTRTEAAVQNAIESLRGERTIFLVAHRLSTIRQADRIVVLDQGRVAQVGDHEKLIGQPGIYRDLIGSQDPQAA